MTIRSRIRQNAARDVTPSAPPYSGEYGYIFEARCH